MIVVAMEQRSQAVLTGERLLGAFAQLTEEQTARTIQNVEQTLEIVEARITTALGTGTASHDAVRKELRDLLANRPFLKQVTILDARGRTMFTSADGEPGLDLSDRAYFGHHRDHPGSGFTLGVPVRARSTAEWIIPATVSLRRADGAFAGVIVASIDPFFFSRAWTADKAIDEHATVLWRNDGTVLIRSPFDERSMGALISGGLIPSHLQSGRKVGTLRTVSLIDGRDRLVAYRAIAAYPAFSLSVTQPMDLVLGVWRRDAGVVALVCVIAGIALTWLALGLVRESNARHVSQDRFRLLFDANPFPMVVLERSSRRFLAINDAAVEEYGWSREVALSGRADDLYLPEDLPALAALRRQDGPDVLRTIKGLRHRTKGGAVIDVEMNSRPIEFGGVPAMLVLTRNVTEKLSAERARLAAEDQLRQAQKMEAVGQLTGGLAHDFNNLLFIILANVEALQDEHQTIDTVRLEEIADAVSRASDLTRQLLAFSRKQPLCPQRTDINELVTSTGKLLRRALGGRVEIDAVLAEDLCIVDIDRSQLEAALVNLCINARDAMPEGGRLLLETKNVTLDSEFAASNPDVVVGDYAMVEVTDTGSGIPPDTLARVFEPFFTTKDVGKGTGLGLSMVYGFVKQSHGHVQIDSKVGFGTTVRLYLPRVEGKSAEVITKEAAAMPRGTERIMVVEDNATVRGHVVNQLRSLGYDVMEAASGTSALECLKSTTICDLLITDVVMPGLLDGKSLADLVILQWPGTPVILMSGYTDNEIVRQGLLPRDMHLMNKPFSKADLATAVRRMLSLEVAAPVV